MGWLSGMPSSENWPTSSARATWDAWPWEWGALFEEPVEDGVAEGGIADDVVPVLDGDRLARSVPRWA